MPGGWELAGGNAKAGRCGAPCRAILPKPLVKLLGGNPGGGTAGSLTGRPEEVLGKGPAGICAAFAASFRDTVSAPCGPLAKAGLDLAAFAEGSVAEGGRPNNGARGVPTLLGGISSVKGLTAGEASVSGDEYPVAPLVCGNDDSRTGVVVFLASRPLRVLQQFRHYTSGFNVHARRVWV